MDIVGRLDVAQLMLYGFWLFFFALVYYLRREDKREGYPLVSPRGPVKGWPSPPGPKEFIPREGERTEDTTHA